MTNEERERKIEELKELREELLEYKKLVESEGKKDDEDEGEEEAQKVLTLRRGR